VRILIHGITGLIGNSLFRTLSANSSYQVYGTCRNSVDKKLFTDLQKINIFPNIDALNFQAIENLFANIKPNVIINCIGITKHLPQLNNYEITILINAVLPHKLANLSDNIEAKLIHLSTDCVFSGQKGNYSETDIPDAVDFYGRSKILGEVIYKNHLTLRISTIGHEIKASYGLLNWFLSQNRSCKGYSRAIFSGLPTVFFAKVLSDFVLPKKDLRGLYHISAKPIDKFSLLKLIAHEYKKTIKIVSDDSFIINRALDGKKFSDETGFVCPDWPELIKIMASTRGTYKNV